MVENRDHLSIVPPLEAAVADGQEDPVLFIMSQEEIDAQLAPLDDQEREVLRLRFGLDIDRPRSFEEVGKALGMLAPSARVLERRAMNKLREIE